jgi:calcineurin-like phosphoesterase family protein
MKTFVISDTHFRHAKIIQYCNRPFVSTDEMDNYMIQQWNKTVSNKDLIIHCGDFCMGPKEEVEKIIEQLNGIKILVKGNHDRATTTWWENRGFEVYKQYMIEDYIFSHKPILDLEYGMYNIHGHIHNVDTVNIKGYDKRIHINVCVEVINYTPIDFEELRRD